jgi:hypothetical protein
VRKSTDGQGSPFVRLIYYMASVLGMLRAV